jgi:hypothetical protein
MQRKSTNTFPEGMTVENIIEVELLMRDSLGPWVVEFQFLKVFLLSSLIFFFMLCCLSWLIQFQLKSIYRLLCGSKLP